MIRKVHHIIHRHICPAISALIIVSIALLMFSSESVVADQSSSEIRITSSTQTVSLGEGFSVDVYVEPGEPINGVAFSLSYDASLVHANFVTLGGLFDPYTPNVFFNPGTIDNFSGTITSVYGFTVPATNTVTDPGTFCTISFTALNNTGTSTLHLYNVSVTNATGNSIIGLIVNDGDIVVNESGSSSPDQPQTSNQAPNTPYKPSGASLGLIETTYTYSTSTIDPNDDEVYFLFDWGDNTTTTWFGPYSSGNTCISSHFWNNSGTYDIKVKAKDNHDTESSWSTALTIEIQNKTQPPENQTENLSPTAFFTHTPKLPNIQETVQFTDQSIDKDGNITKWLWDFGDSTISTQQHPTYKYTNNRTYIVTLTAWDNNETTNTTYLQITVSSITSETTNGNETPGLGLTMFLTAIAIFIIIRKRKKLNK